MEQPLVAAHVSILLITFIVIAYVDHRALNYFRGKEVLLPKRLITFAHLAVLLGLLGMIGTGFLLVLPAWQVYLQDPTWYIKMCFVALLVANSFIIGQLSKIAHEKPFASLSREERQVLILSGVISGISWLAAATIGYSFL